MAALMEALGPKIRKHRRRLGLTLDELAGRTGISKPYLSLIETGRVANPPSDEKLRRLEQSLGFTPGELVAQAHLQRTPRDVRAMLQNLMAGGGGSGFRVQDSGEAHIARVGSASADAPVARSSGPASAKADPTHSATQSSVLSPQSSASPLPTDLDAAYMSGLLQEMVDRSSGNIEQVTANAVPVINRVSAGYPRDFSDLGYPPRVADEYVSCPDVHDRDAFAARVHGDSMVPKYREGDIVIFSPAAAPREGDDCFVRFADGHTTFKRVFFESDEAGQSVLRLQPRNERYRPLTVPSENVAGLYRAVFRYQRVDED
jgi:phage repressor protein C with HTH and peptisase S24 domain/transcriptional regulator with XRE-family HTH domain